MELHVDVEPFAFLIGTWSGEGRGHYPTIDDFTYTETITFTAIPGKPFLKYEQRTMSPTGTPMHTESGFLRFVGGDALEFTLAQPTGQVEILEGTTSADHRSLTFTSTSVGNSPTAKTVTSTARRYTLDENLTAIHSEFDMAAVGADATNHLTSDLRKA